MEKKSNPKALLPIGIYLILYLGVGITFEYILKIPMGFYNVPIIVFFLVALLIACLQNRSVSFDKKFEIMGRGVGDKNIIIMILIFLEAGIFVGVVGRGSASSVAYFMLSLIPVQYAVVILFVVSCFVSLAMGTSVGTITLLTPIASAVAQSAGFPAAFCIGSVVGGAMFGDNLSFISDTTIAVCNGQGCNMRDKFRENFKIVVPAAIVSVGIIWIISMKCSVDGYINNEYDLLQIIPYILVLVCSLLGMSVFLALLIGILCGTFILLVTGNMNIVQIMTNMGSGAAGMFDTSMVAILVSAICALISENGGFQALLNGIRKVFKGSRGGQLGMGLMVVAMDIATANNTVAIVMANPIAREMSELYGISSKKTASILDSFSCVAQGIIPYGAQILVAISAAEGMGIRISAFDIMPYLIYPYLLCLSYILFIFLASERKK
ncbi:MAG: Na+/H+ antiporter NhaC family protein [Spirochaetia bacterium]|nr:Na+/H+ antiporter NhaC family protein [Spirochaetia bacterium]